MGYMTNSLGRKAATAKLKCDGFFFNDTCVVLGHELGLTHNHWITISGLSRSDVTAFCFLVSTTYGEVGKGREIRVLISCVSGLWPCEVEAKWTVFQMILNVFPLNSKTCQEKPVIL